MDWWDGNRALARVSSCAHRDTDLFQAAVHRVLMLWCTWYVILIYVYAGLGALDITDFIRPQPPNCIPKGVFQHCSTLFRGPGIYAG